MAGNGALQSAAITLKEAMVGDISRGLWILLAAVGLILLLAAVNLGTLVLGRSIERAREMAVRTALGASRTRLVRQLIAEQAVIAAIGALAGLADARPDCARRSTSSTTCAARCPPEPPRFSTTTWPFTTQR